MGGKYLRVHLSPVWAKGKARGLSDKTRLGITEELGLGCPRGPVSNRRPSGRSFCIQKPQWLCPSAPAPGKLVHTEACVQQSPKEKTTNLAKHSVINRRMNKHNGGIFSLKEEAGYMLEQGRALRTLCDAGSQAQKQNIGFHVCVTSDLCGRERG